MRHFSEDFIDKCRKGDSQAQKELFEQLYASMFRVCQRYVGQVADAEDCMMKGFMKAFQNFNNFRYDGEQSLFIWIRKIMVNESLMFIRQKHNFLISIDEQFVDVSFPAEILQRIDAEELNAMILALPTGYRTVFNLNIVEGYDHKTIAKMLGISESTSRTQLAKARTRLRNLIEQNQMNYEQAGR